MTRKVYLDADSDQELVVVGSDGCPGSRTFGHPLDHGDHPQLKGTPFRSNLNPISELPSSRGTEAEALSRLLRMKDRNQVCARGLRCRYGACQQRHDGHQGPRERERHRIMWCDAD